MAVFALLFLFVLFVAYANGANDNFKGVATLFGANVTSYRTAIALATVAALAGGIASIFLASGLVQAFSGKGLVPAAIAASPAFLLAVAAGAGGTVILATWLGFPVSTTHGLIGALIGAGYMAAGDKINLVVLGSAFFLPLLVSPVISILLTMPLYKIAHALTLRLGITKESCICIAPGQFAPALAAPSDACCAEAMSCGAGAALPILDVSVGQAPACVEKYSGAVFGLTAQKLIDAMHYVSAFAVSFARSLNDTPKIVAPMLVIKALDLRVGMAAVVLAMALGGLINARNVAETMSRKISTMNDGQALTANLVTAFLVIFASRLGLPVSTTQVSVGAISGIGIVNGSVNREVIGQILLSWVLTLPVAAMVGAAVYLAFGALR